MNLGKITTSVLLLPVLLCLQSCLAVAAVGAGMAGAYWWTKSETAIVDAEPDVVVHEVHAELESLGLDITESMGTALDGKVVAKTAKDETVRVLIDAHPDGGSKVVVRVGLVDEESARWLLNRVLMRLGEPLIPDPEEAGEEEEPASASSVPE